MARRKTPSWEPRTVQIKLEGKTYTGSYTVDRESITVSYGDISESTHLGGFKSRPAGLARLLLEKMVKGEGV